MPPKKKNEVKDVSTSFSMLMLLVGLGLSALNLWYMTDRSGSLAGALSSLQSLQMNYGQRHAPAKEPAVEAPVPQPIVVWSVAKYRDGEETMLQTNLVVPLLMHYAPMGGTLKAVLVERKNPSSKDVNVRLFMADGTETSYLWPSTHAEGGDWSAE